MKTSLVFLLSLLHACAFLAAEEPAPLSVAVLGFGAQKDIEPESEKLALLLGVQLSEHPELQLVERLEIDKVLGEQELTLTGTIQPDTAAKIGHIVGAQVLITGRLIEVSGKRMAVVKLIGVETSRVVSVSAEFAGEPGLADAAKKLAGQIAERLRDPKSAFTAEVETWDAMIARLKALLPAGKERPSIRVQIPEQHLTRRVPDPAAQTEIQRVLQQLGFKLVESGPADYIVEGEAFSERAGQRGQLIFCKARLEVKVADAKGEKIWVDRQTSSAIDLAENIAAKSALQVAGRSVAERLVEQFFAVTLKP
ncbi:MAG: curli assembly protein CsgG [Verrucomicrobia bacterium]|nr:curli assembly protein CsgG [Verrucomicrobiota bacterium]